MSRTNRNIDDLIKNERFVQWIIQPTSESAHYWNKWLLANPERKYDVEHARQIIQSVQYKFDEKMPESDYDTVLENIVNYSHGNKNNMPQQHSYYWKIAGIAASIVLLMIVGSFLANKNGRELADIQTVSTDTVSRSTLKGQKLKFQLPDGSRVILNAESKISYTLPFNSNRSIKLTGEAFFDVRKDEAHPFTIRSGDITTRVVGTSFNVRAYPEETHKSIAVVTGKVKVSDSKGNQASLAPNVRGVFNLDEKQLLIASFSAKKEIGWKDGFITFDDEPLPAVFRYLERWYGVNMVIKDSLLLEGNYTGTYQNASLQKVMNGVSFTSGFKYAIENKTVHVWK